MPKQRFVGIPKDDKGKVVKTYLYDFDGNKVRQVLWGDWLTVDGEIEDTAGQVWCEVIWAPNSNNPETLYIQKEHTAEERPLEIVFLDVGQGDGAVLITPERFDGEAAPPHLPCCESSIFSFAILTESLRVSIEGTRMTKRDQYTAVAMTSSVSRVQPMTVTVQTACFLLCRFKTRSESSYSTFFPQGPKGLS